MTESETLPPLEWREKIGKILRSLRDPFDKLTVEQLEATTRPNWLELITVEDALGKKILFTAFDARVAGFMFPMYTLQYFWSDNPLDDPINVSQNAQGLPDDSLQPFFEILPEIIRRAQQLCPAAKDRFDMILEKFLPSGN